MRIFVSLNLLSNRKKSFDFIPFLRYYSGILYSIERVPNQTIIFYNLILNITYFTGVPVEFTWTALILKNEHFNRQRRDSKSKQLHFNGDVRYNFILKKRYQIYLVYYSRSKALKINVKSSDMYFEKDLIRNWFSNELNFN